MSDVLVKFLFAFGSQLSLLSSIGIATPFKESEVETQSDEPRTSLVLGRGYHSIWTPCVSDPVKKVIQRGICDKYRRGVHREAVEIHRGFSTEVSGE